MKMIATSGHPYLLTGAARLEGLRKLADEWLRPLYISSRRAPAHALHWHRNPDNLRIAHAILGREHDVTAFDAYEALVPFESDLEYDDTLQEALAHRWIFDEEGEAIAYDRFAISVIEERLWAYFLSIPITTVQGEFWRLMPAVVYFVRRGYMPVLVEDPAPGVFRETELAHPRAILVITSVVSGIGPLARLNPDYLGTARYAKVGGRKYVLDIAFGGPTLALAPRALISSRLQPRSAVDVQAVDAVNLNLSDGESDSDE